MTTVVEQPKQKTYYAAGIPDESIWAIAQNATRHLVEADAHFKSERYASSVASAVLSCEEMGKAHFIAFTGKDFSKKRLAHATHQIVVIALLKFFLSIGKSSHWQTTLKKGLGPDEVLSVEQERDLSAHPEFRVYVDSLRAGQLTEPGERVAALANAWTAQEQRDGTQARWEPLFKGALHKLRMAATYVDLDATGRVLTGPSKIERGDAEFLCMCAYGLAYTAFNVTLAPRLQDHLQEFRDSIPPDLTGSEVVHKVAKSIIDAVAKGAANVASPAAQETGSPQIT